MPVYDNMRQSSNQNTQSLSESGPGQNTASHATAPGDANAPPYVPLARSPLTPLPEGHADHIRIMSRTLFLRPTIDTTDPCP